MKKSKVKDLIEILNPFEDYDLETLTFILGSKEFTKVNGDLKIWTKDTNDKKIILEFEPDDKLFFD